VPFGRWFKSRDGRRFKTTIPQRRYDCTSLGAEDGRARNGQPTARDWQRISAMWAEAFRYVWTKNIEAKPAKSW
jgi:hypothetical protein